VGEEEKGALSKNTEKGGERKKGKKQKGSS